MSSVSTNKSNNGRSNSARLKQNACVAAQTSIDAKLHVDFEEFQHQFDYSTSVDLNLSGSSSNIPSDTVSAYPQNIQRDTLIQSFGCLIAVDEQNLRVIAYSENAPEMLDLAPYSVPSIEHQQEALTVGIDVLPLFQPSGAAALRKAFGFTEVNLLNPILVHSKFSGKPFYAILHRIDVGLVLDLEPVNPADVPVTAAGALMSYKLAAKAISRLQSLSSGNILMLCDVLVKEVHDLTGYDRVMVYKFHEDEHGEVIAEYHRPGLEPYVGLHYPATDIPQASRFLFMKNKVRLICDCMAPTVKVIQDKKLAQPLSLSGSTLRAPHSCHSQYMVNMGSIASLVMSVMINEDDYNETESNHKKPRKLWGLVLCHHTSPRFVPFPLRYACEFLIQVFSVQINKEVELTAQMKEKHVLRTQTVLCDMLLRDTPVAIVVQSPNVMDLIKCDGAALFYKNKFWLLGITPTEDQIRDLVSWLNEYHSGSTGQSTDSLMEAGYHGASVLGGAVCGMAAIRISSKDFLFWFRAQTAKEIKWGGANHNPKEKDNGRKMHPRSSFNAFLEVVKWRSLPWEDMEMDAIHSLQLILRGSMQDGDVLAVNDSKMIVEVISVDDRIQRVDELRVITNEMVRLIETAAVPIFAVDVSGAINGWNFRAAEITGLPIEKAIGKPLVNLAEADSVDIINNMISSASKGIGEKNIEIKLKTFGPQRHNSHVIFVVNACCSRDGNENVVGISFVAQDLTGYKQAIQKCTRVQGDYAGIIRNPSALIPPIIMIDEHGRCLEWNDAMQKLSGLSRDEAIEQSLLGEVFTVNSFGCRVKDYDTFTKLKILLNEALAGQDTDNLLFGFFEREGKYVEVLLSAKTRTNAEGRVTGVLLFLHVPSPELQRAVQMQRISEQSATNSLNKLAYVREEIITPLKGITFMQNLMEDTELNDEQRKLVNTGKLCLQQIIKIVDDTDIQSIEECYAELDSVEFNLGDTIEAVIKQAMAVSEERLIHLICDLPKELMSTHLCGDTFRLQQVLSDFLTNALLFTPAFQGASVRFRVIPWKERIGINMHLMHLEFRITHPAPGIPEALIREEFNQRQSFSREGLGLYMSQKLVKIMNGTVQYLREAETSTLIILIEFPMA